MSDELTIIAAIGLGALHSMEPGHGKGVLSAYIISTRANVFQATLLGIISAFSHALSIFLLAFLAALSVHTITPDHLTHWISIISGLIIIYIGVKRLYHLYHPKIQTVKKWAGHHHSKVNHHHHNEAGFHDHDHHGHEDHHHFHVHHNEPTNLVQFFSVGFFTGIIPCPSALAIILAALGAHHWFLGFKLVIAFSIGSGITMAILGYLISKTSDKLYQFEKNGFIKAITVLSSVIIIVLGLYVFFSPMFFDIT